MKGTCIPDADGYQWGVRWSDGGISKGWNGATQLDRAQEFIFLMKKTYPNCTVSRWTLVRRQIVPRKGQCKWGWGDADGGWEHVDIDPWRKPLTNYLRTMRSFDHPLALLPAKVHYVMRGHTLARILGHQAASRLRVKLIKGEHQ